MIKSISPDNKPLVISSGIIVLLILIGTSYTMWTEGSARMLSSDYLLTQLRTSSYLGLAAAGMMMVILLGHIDLSIPWTITAAAMLATTVGGELAIPVGLGVGLLVGLFNGLGVAILRIPSMIFTLGVDSVMRGLMVALTGGFAPQTAATPMMEFLAKDRILGIPVAIFVWIAVSIILIGILRHTAFGRSVYATGNQEGAAYLSGIRTRLIIIGCFMLSGVCAALAGILLAGYASQATQGMGNEYLLPAIAAVVVGGTRILGGKGKYLGTVIGVILIVVLNSVLSIMQMPEAGRQIIYGMVIISMLLLYGRTAKVTS